MTSADFIELPKVANLYNHSYRKMLRSGILKTKLWSELLAGRDSAMNIIAAKICPKTVECFFEWTICQIAPLSNLLDPKWFQRDNELISPLVSLTHLKTSISQMPLDYLSLQFKKSPYLSLIDEILKNSIFVKGDLRFRSDMFNGRLTIFGCNEPTLINLGCLAHELGHCFFESRALQNCKDFALKSEKLALVFEEHLIASNAHCSLIPYLSIKDWIEYCEIIDRINIYFYFWELARTEKFRYLSKIIDTDFFDSGLLMLRESLFTKPGYQSIYAFSSKARWILRQEISQDSKLKESFSQNICRIYALLNL